jgi:diaminohydroxyphosphoribosylaminopyrimidine deaminase/5-amino-6-(5-phosphoribosylamino)uracil reductase
MDVNPFVRGKGIQKLIAAGCDVKVGVLEEEAKHLNRRFYTFHQQKKPYIILKWAQTKDHFIGVKNKRVIISGAAAKKAVHSWRAEEQAIMVGTNTALWDNPKLTVREVKGNNPVRVVMDRELKIPLHYHLLKGRTPTLVFTDQKKSNSGAVEYIPIRFDKNIIHSILNTLYQRSIQSIMIEGGAKLLQSFMDANCWNEARIITSKQVMIRHIPSHLKIAAPLIKGKIEYIKKMGNDKLEVWSNPV